MIKETRQAPDRTRAHTRQQTYDYKSDAMIITLHLGSVCILNMTVYSMGKKNYDVLRLWYIKERIPNIVNLIVIFNQILFGQIAIQQNLLQSPEI